MKHPEEEGRFWGIIIGLVIGIFLVFCFFKWVGPWILSGIRPPDFEAKKVIQQSVNPEDIFKRQFYDIVVDPQTKVQYIKYSNTLIIRVDEKGQPLLAK